MISTLLATLASALRAQQPDLYDTSVVRTLELTFKQNDYWTQLTNNWPDKVYVKADLRVGNVVLPDVGVRFRGNSSYWGIGSSLKKPLEIATDEFFDQKLWGYKTLNLNNNYVDPSFVREVVGYEILRKFTPAPKSNYVIVKINGQVWGPYINTQQVNKDFLREWYPSEDGNRYRAERPEVSTPPNYTAFNYLGTNLAEYMKGFQITSEGSLNPWVDLLRTTDVLNNTPANALQAELPKVLDVDNVLTVLALGNSLLWLDSYVGVACHNFYVYHDEWHDRLHVIPWDMNSCLGSYNDFLTVPLETLTPYYSDDRIGNIRPLMTKLIAQPEYKQRFVAKLRRFKDELDWPVYLRGRIKRLQDLIEPAMLADPHRLYPISTFRGNVTNDVDLGPGFLIRSLEAITKGRFAYLSQHPDVARIGVHVSNLTHSPASPTTSDPILVSVSAPSAAKVTLFWRYRGPWTEAPMFDDGQHGDGAAHDGVWAATLAAQTAGTRIEYYAAAETASGVWTDWTNYGNGYQKPSFSVQWDTRPSPVLINEFLAQNNTVIQDENSQYEDWIELINTSDQAVDVSGMYLSDDLADPKQWAIPANTSIPAHGTLHVWADNDPQDGPMHATFKLSAGGEEISLVDATGTVLLDHVTFGQQQPDISAGRLIDGALPWVCFPVPTPLTPNQPAVCGTRRYVALDPLSQIASLDLGGLPTIGSSPILQVDNARPSGAVVFLVDAIPGYFEVAPGLTWLVGPTPPILFAVPSDAAGMVRAPLPIPDDVSLVGQSAYLQAFTLDLSTFDDGGAIQVEFCAK
ncbi:MAG: CotH kinase family protein [Planctomycetes bacterium]|nr:CotH kinase family protein [Planctomycetota bacterium]